MVPIAFCNAQVTSLNEIRILFKEAAGNHEACNKLIDQLNISSSLSEPIVLGYKGSATMMKAKYVINPFSKLSNFLNGKKLLEKGISEDPGNAELRYLRFTIQNNTPSFLGYKANIKQDKNFLIASLPAIQDVALKQMITTYINTLNH